MAHPPRILQFDDAAIADAARLVSAGQPVAVPTETVYGLAADATDPAAVARIFAAKGRPSFNPLIVHVADLAAAEQLGVFDDAARSLAVAHWPGPLTLVVPLRPDAGIASLVTAGLATVALRVPAHPAMQALLAACARPLAAPSANASGRISPTETVYGLAADATDPAAVARIFAAKGRPSFNPLIVHVANLAAAEQLGVFDDAARALAVAHWPGPLTLVVPLRLDAGIASLVTAGLATVALRVPAHPAMQALLAACARPLAAPSANASGRISPTRAAHVVASLGDRVALVIDGGPTQRGIESTIVAATGGALRLLRRGPIDIPGLDLADTQSVEAPGQLVSHYAPTKPLRLDATVATADEFLIGFGPIAGDVSLSHNGDPVEAAARLFDLLHQADASLALRIAVAPIPGPTLAAAIRDRLERAAAPRG